MQIWDAVWDEVRSAPLQTLKGLTVSPHSPSLRMVSGRYSSSIRQLDKGKGRTNHLASSRPPRRTDGRNMVTLVLAQGSGRILIMRVKIGPKVV